MARMYRITRRITRSSPSLHRSSIATISFSIFFFIKNPPLFICSVLTTPVLRVTILLTVHFLLLFYHTLPAISIPITAILENFS
nr:MAG TPA: hypothetical protein [Caudoviricetes sp.]